MQRQSVGAIGWLGESTPEGTGAQWHTVLFGQTAPT